MLSLEMLYQYQGYRGHATSLFACSMPCLLDEFGNAKDFVKDVICLRNFGNVNTMTQEWRGHHDDIKPVASPPVMQLPYILLGVCILSPALYRMELLRFSQVNGNTSTRPSNSSNQVKEKKTEMQALQGTGLRDYRIDNSIPLSDLENEVICGAARRLRFLLDVTAKIEALFLP